MTTATKKISEPDDAIAPVRRVGPKSWLDMLEAAEQKGWQIRVLTEHGGRKEIERRTTPLDLAQFVLDVHKSRGDKDDAFYRLQALGGRPLLARYAVTVVVCMQGGWGPRLGAPRSE